MPELFAVWEKEGWEEPQIEEKLDDVERTILTLPFKKKLEKKVPKKRTNKTTMHYERILSIMEPGVWVQANEFMEVLGLKERRTRGLLRELVAMGALEDNGATKGKKYRKL